MHSCKAARLTRELLCTQLLGAQGAHNVGLILAESYDRKTKKRRRPFETVVGLAKDLGLKVDVECEVDDPKCVRHKVDQYAREGGKGDVVVCWVRHSLPLSRSLKLHEEPLTDLEHDLATQKHSMLHKIAHELGAKTRPYPDERCVLLCLLSRYPSSFGLHRRAKLTPYIATCRYDIMWTLRNGRVVKKESERCPGLDPQHPRKHDGDLEIDARDKLDEEDEEEDDEAEDDEEESVSLWDEYEAETSAGQWQLGGLDQLD